ncbi:MAG: 3-hydroxy-9,10-secoandrosta-1,3,5(10)-triene-9,17-dione monooxygenase oxygenase subunit [Acidimicrobiales bacterium]
MNDRFLEGVTAVLGDLRDRARDIEERRRVSDDSMKQLIGTGVFRALQPARYGGLELEAVVFYEAVRRIAGACGSTGWVASIIGVHPWQLALFPDQAQADVWSADPDTLVSSSYAPTGRVDAVDGGYRVTGRWNFSSGCDHAQWVFLGGAVLDAAGKPIDFGTVLVPRNDFVIDDVWDTVGLRGTGSNDVVVDDAFVPLHRFLSFMDTARCQCPGHAVNKAPLYRLPFASVFSNTITAPIIGMAQGAYDAHVAMASERLRISYGGQRVVDDGFAQVRIASAASEIDAAWLQLERNMRDLTHYAVDDARIPMELRARARRDQVRGTERAIEAIDTLFENSGGHALRRGTPIERAWRDAHSGRAHVVNDPERALAMYGKLALGLSIDQEPMV